MITAKDGNGVLVTVHDIGRVLKVPRESTLILSTGRRNIRVLSRKLRVDIGSVVVKE